MHSPHIQIHTFTVVHTKNSFLTSYTPIIRTYSLLASHPISLSHSLLIHSSHSNFTCSLILSLIYSSLTHDTDLVQTSPFKLIQSWTERVCHKGDSHQKRGSRCLVSGRFPSVPRSGGTEGVCCKCLKSFTSVTRREGWKVFVTREFHICYKESGNGKCLSLSKIPICYK